MTYAAGDDDCAAANAASMERMRMVERMMTL
jgi:hypothetical protein